MSDEDRSSGFPSLTALLGMLAVAGYQNRDKISEWLGGKGQLEPDPRPGNMLPPGPIPSPQPNQSDAGALAGGGGLGGLLGGLLGAGGAGALVNGGLGELIDRFNQSGQSQKADSWVQQGPNEEVAPNELEQVLGPEVLTKISQHTGLSRDELLDRLSRVLPDAVDRYTPGGNLNRG